MPYSGADDSKLPSNVKKLGAGDRRRWIAIWNSAFKNCMDPSKGGGSGGKGPCEAAAFKFANGAVKQRADPVSPYIEQLGVEYA